MANPGIPSGGVFTNLTGIEQCNFIVGTILGETTRRGQAGKAGTDDNPVGGLRDLTMTPEYAP